MRLVRVSPIGNGGRCGWDDLKVGDLLVEWCCDHGNLGAGKTVTAIEKTGEKYRLSLNGAVMHDPILPTCRGAFNSHEVEMSEYGEVAP